MVDGWMDVCMIPGNIMEFSFLQRHIEKIHCPQKKEKKTSKCQKTFPRRGKIHVVSFCGLLPVYCMGGLCFFSLSPICSFIFPQRYLIK